MFEIPRDSVNFLKHTAITSADSLGVPAEQIETQVLEILTQPTDIAFHEALLKLDSDAQNKRIGNERRELARVAISYAPAMYPDSLTRTTAGLAYSISRAIKDGNAGTYDALAYMRGDTFRKIPGFNHGKTLGKRLPRETASNHTKRSYMYLSELFMRAGDYALKELGSNYSIMCPTMYPLDMLVDQLGRGAEQKGKPEALIIACRDDNNGALHNDNVYESIAKACAKPKSPVLPTIVEFGGVFGGDELIDELIQPRNLVLGFINSHGNWENINGMQKDALYNAILPIERAAIRQNWQHSAGIGLLTCYGGAQGSGDGEDGVDVTVAEIIKRPVVASDSLTGKVSVTRRTGRTDCWTVNFHVPIGSERVATLHTPRDTYQVQNLAVLDRRTVFYDPVAA